MTIDIYAAVQDDDGTFRPVVPFDCSWRENMRNGEFTPNAEFIPGAAMNMPHGNWLYLVNSVLSLDSVEIEEMALAQIRKAALHALITTQIDYYIERIIQLINICDLGISRGAQRLAVL